MLTTLHFTYWATDRMLWYLKHEQPYTKANLTSPSLKISLPYFQIPQSPGTGVGGGEPHHTVLHYLDYYWKRYKLEVEKCLNRGVMLVILRGEIRKTFHITVHFSFYFVMRAQHVYFNSKGKWTLWVFSSQLFSSWPIWAVPMRRIKACTCTGTYHTHELCTEHATFYLTSHVRRKHGAL